MRKQIIKNGVTYLRLTDKEFNQLKRIMKTKIKGCSEERAKAIIKANCGIEADDIIKELL